MGRDSGRRRAGHKWRETVYGPVRSDFADSRLADLCDPLTGIQTGPFGSQLHQKDYVPVGTPIITVEHLGENRILHDAVPRVSEQDRSRLSKYSLQKGDIVFSRVGSVDRRALVRTEETGWLFSGRCLRIRPNPQKIDAGFLSYFFGTPSFKNHVRAIAVGTTMPSLNTQLLSDIRVPHSTDIDEQRAIAHILGTLDDKIELNRRMNETLEEMARALFKSWFIDFDPVHAKAALKRHAATQITPPLRGSRQAKGDSPQARRWGEIRRHYSPQTLQKAQALRQNQTNAEGLLWHYLGNKQLGGYKFRRQQPIGPYIADFACLSEKLLIELDGGQHAEQTASDARRDEFLQKKGYRVLRFWNHEVFENCFGVLERIYAALPHHPPLTHHPPLEGGSEDASLSGRGSPPPPQPAPDGLASATPPPGGSDWSVERAQAYLDGIDPSIAALFPDGFVDSELGKIPEGWEVKPLGKVIELAYGKALKAAARKGGTIPVYGSNGQVGWHDKKLVTGPGIIVGRKGNPGVITWVQSDFFPIDTTFYVVPKEGKQSLYFLFYALERQGLADLTADSAVPGLNRNLAYMNKLLIPDDMAIVSFNEYAKTLFARRHRLEEETRTLAALRDTLLPKLISGELRVEDSKRFLESVSSGD